MNPICKKRLGAIRLETMKVVAQEEIAPAIFELVLEGEMVGSHASRPISSSACA